MNIELIMIGNELISGETPDANAFFMANALTEKGFQVTLVSMVGDQEDRIGETLARARIHADAVVVSGGLGPTSDDLTAAAAAKAFAHPLVLREEILEEIRARFTKRGVEMPRSNEKQAILPLTAEIISNPVGTAPGFSIRSMGTLFFFFQASLENCAICFRNPFSRGSRRSGEKKSITAPGL